MSMSRTGKATVFSIICCIIVAIIFGTFTLIGALASPSERYSVELDFTSDSTLTDKCLDITIQNLQDSSDNLDIKTILNETNFDISGFSNPKFYFYKDVEVEVPDSYELCNPYNATLNSTEYVVENCTTVSNGSHIEIIQDYVEQQLLQSNEGDGEVKQRWENIPIQKHGNEKDTVMLRHCFHVPFAETSSGWGNAGTVYVDVNSELFVDKTLSSWFNETYRKCRDIADMRVESSPRYNTFLVFPLDEFLNASDWLLENFIVVENKSTAIRYECMNTSLINPNISCLDAVVGDKFGFVGQTYPNGSYYHYEVCFNNDTLVPKNGRGGHFVYYSENVSTFLGDPTTSDETISFTSSIAEGYIIIKSSSDGSVADTQYFQDPNTIGDGTILSFQTLSDYATIVHPSTITKIATYTSNEPYTQRAKFSTVTDTSDFSNLTDQNIVVNASLPMRNNPNDAFTRWRRLMQSNNYTMFFVGVTPYNITLYLDDAPTYTVGIERDFNNAPEIPNITYPLNNTVETNFTVVIGNSSDVDGDNTNFTLWVSTTSDFSNEASYYNSTINDTYRQVHLSTDGTYYLRALAFDGTANSSWSGTVNVSYDSLPPNMSFLQQDPADIDNFNLFSNNGYVNVSYNISDGHNVNSSNVSFYYKVNSSSSETFKYVNGTATTGYQLLSDSSEYQAGTNWTAQFDESDVYPATYFYDDEFMEAYGKVDYDLDNNIELIIMEHYNVSNSKNNSFLEMYIDNQTASSLTARFYGCNTSFSFDNEEIDTTSNCSLFYNLEASTVFNHSHSVNSSHHVIPMAINITTGELNGIYVTETFYIAVQGRTGTNGWNVKYITNVTRADAVRYTINDCVTWSNLSGTVDTHIHQYDGAEKFWYHACSQDEFNNNNCSVERSDQIELGGLPPTSPDVTSPTSGLYSGIHDITIEYTASLSPNGYPITLYNISLADVNQSYVQAIQSNNTENLSYVWSSAGVDGEYFIRVEACDNLGQCSFGFSENITIDSTRPSIILENPADSSSQTEGSITFYYYVNESNGISNCTLDFNGTNYTETTVNVNTANETFIRSLTEGVYNWTIYCYDSAGNLNVSDTRKLTLDASPVTPTGDIGGGGGGGITMVNASIGESIERNLYVFEQPRDMTEIIIMDMNIRKCSTKNLDIPCAIDGDEATLAFSVDIGNKFTGIVKDTVVIETSDRNTTEIQIEYRIVNFGLYAPLKEKIAKSYHLSFEFLFAVKDNTRVGIRLLPFALLLVAVGIIFLIRWIVKLKRKGRVMEFKQLKKAIGG